MFVSRKTFVFIAFFVGRVRGNDVNFDADEEPQECDYRLILAARALNPRRLICRISR